MGVINFSGDSKYENNKFYLEQFYFIENNKPLVNNKEHQNKLIYKLIQELISYIITK